MRHRKKKTRFGRQQAHRIATLNGITRSVIKHQRIKTTHTKAKEARKVVENLITVAKKDTLAARRKAFAILRDRVLVSVLFKEIVPLFNNRTSGYTRIIPFNFRKGDGASVVFLELTERKVEEKVKPAKKAKKGAHPEKTKGVKKEKPSPPTAAPHVEPELKEEKAIEDIKRKKAKDEERKIEKQKGFLKKVKGFFRRKTNM